MNLNPQLSRTKHVYVCVCNVLYAVYYLNISQQSQHRNESDANVSEYIISKIWATHEHFALAHRYTHTHGVVNILPRSMLPLIHELAHSLPIALHCVHCLCTTQNFCLSAPGTLSAGEKKTHIHIDIWDLHIAHRTSHTVHILHFYVSHSLPYSLLLHFHIPINWNILHKMHFRSIIVALLSFHRIIKLEISEEEWQQKKWFVCLCKFLVWEQEQEQLRKGGQRRA